MTHPMGTDSFEEAKLAKPERTVTVETLLKCCCTHNDGVLLCRGYRGVSATGCQNILLYGFVTCSKVLRCECRVSKTSQSGKV